MDTKVIQATTVANGSTEKIESWTVPDGELWLLGEFTAEIVNDYRGGNSGDNHEIELRAGPSVGKYRVKTSLAKNDMDGLEYNSENAGEVNTYVYPGETVEIVETVDAADNASEIGATVFLRRVL